MVRVGGRLAAVIALGATWFGCSGESGDGPPSGGSSGDAGVGATGGSGAVGSGGSGAQAWGGAAGQSGGASGSGGGTGGSGATGGAAGSAGGPSCGELAQQNGWAQASCEWNGNNACGGQGTPTYDCDFCCEVGGSGGNGGSGGSSSNGFGYPVGDKSTSPAGGWVVWQVLSHYWSDYGGRHLAQDISIPGGTSAIDAPVYSVADGVVAYAKPNSSAYKNVLLIEHDVGDGSKVCSFYGHINPPNVQAGQSVKRGDQVATVKNWAECVSGGSASNTHLHYVLVSEELCNKVKNSGSGSGICGYDAGGPTALGRSDVGGEPYHYTSVNDACGSHTVVNGFISPTKFIDDHHF